MANTGVNQNDEVLQTALRRLNARAWGIAVGLLLGFGLFMVYEIGIS